MAAGLKINDFPVEMVAAVAEEGQRAADMVGSFLNQLRNDLELPTSFRFPVDFLLRLAAALRLHMWDVAGLRVHIDASLPQGVDAIASAFTDLPGQIGRPVVGYDKLLGRVVGCFMNRLAWHGRRDLQADIVLDNLNDDAVLDALAEFLWAHRHSGPVTTSP